MRVLIGEVSRLLDGVDHIHTEALHALFKPEAHHIVHIAAKLLIFPIEVALVGGKGGEVILAAFFILLPCAAAEKRHPVVGRASVFAGPENVVVAVFGGFIGKCSLKPRMLVRRMVCHKIHHDADVTCFRLGKKGVKILHGAEIRMDCVIIGNVVAVVRIRRGVHRRKP